MKKLQWPEISAMNSETDSVEIFLKNFFIEASKSKTAITARLAEAVLRKVQKNNKRALRKVMRVFFENFSFDRLPDVRLKKFKRHSIRHEKLRYPCAFHVILNIFIFALRKVMKVDNLMFGTLMFN